LCLSLWRAHRSGGVQACRQQLGNARRGRDAVVVATGVAQVVHHRELLVGIDVLERLDDARRVGGIQPGQRVVD
jgi:hypothetical protein